MHADAVYEAAMSLYMLSPAVQDTDQWIGLRQRPLLPLDFQNPSLQVVLVVILYWIRLHLKTDTLGVPRLGEQKSAIIAEKVCLQIFRTWTVLDSLGIMRHGSHPTQSY